MAGRSIEGNQWPPTNAYGQPTEGRRHARPGAVDAPRRLRQAGDRRPAQGPRPVRRLRRGRLLLLGIGGVLLSVAAAAGPADRDRHDVHRQLVVGPVPHHPDRRLGRHLPGPEGDQAQRHEEGVMTAVADEEDHPRRHRGQVPRAPGRGRRGRRPGQGLRRWPRPSCWRSLRSAWPSFLGRRRGKTQRTVVEIRRV